MRKIDIKYIFFTLLALVVIVAGGYKYYEWYTLNSFAKTYNDTWNNELKMAQTLNTTTNEYYALINTDEERTSEDLDKLLSQNSLIIDQAGQYKEIVQKNKKTYEDMNKQPDLFPGNKKEFSNELTTLKLSYYDQELANIEKATVALYFFNNLFTTGKDGIILQEFEEKAQGDTSYYNNIQEVVALKKYTEDNYTFEHEDEIKKDFPKAYDFLKKTEAFYGTYYEVVEDFAKGDLESAGYKATKLQEDALDLNIDSEELLKDPKYKDELKKSLETVSKQTLLIKDFEKNNVTKYPLLPSVTDYEEDLVVCHFYAYKSMDLYHEVMHEYPKAKNVTELIRELDKISPRTEALDKSFDKNSLSFSNNNKKISFVCSDKEQKDRFTFEAVKE